ncbi:MAG: hypothetical protein H6684_14730 [Deltaproteobacteria bacterium]|nr:hypothetical protein [Deltaproteobacteria bacterium]
MKFALKTILALVFITAFAASANARTIYWDGVENRFDWEVVNQTGDTGKVWYFHERYPDFPLTTKNAFVGSAGVYCLDVGCGGKFHADATLISDQVPLPDSAEVTLRTRMYLAYYKDPEDLVDSSLSFGLSTITDDSLILAPDLLPAPVETPYRYDYLAYDISQAINFSDEFLRENETARFWWRLRYSDVTSGDVGYKAVVTDICHTVDCPEQMELRAHTGQVDGYLDVNAIFGHDDIDVISCMQAGEVPGYLRGLKGLWHQGGGAPSYDLEYGRLLIFRTDDAPGSAPASGDRPSFGVYAQAPTEATWFTQDAICDEMALAPLQPGENICVGLNIWASFDYPVNIAYQNVGTGNSHSYMRVFNRIKEKEPSPWVGLDDKEFLFSATMDVDCEDPWPTTTTTTTTTGGSSTTTSTTVSTSTTTTSTMPMDDDDDSVDDDLTDDDSSDDDTATEDDAATSDDDDDDNDDGGVCGS